MRILLMAILLIIFYSCSNKNIEKFNYTDSVIEIDLLSRPEAKVTRLSEIATNIEYIPLQTTNNSLLGSSIRKIVCINNRIYIKSWDEILCFNIDGKFLFKLQDRGRGPEEYTNIWDFDVSSDNKILIVLSSLINKLLIYEISDTGFTFQKSLSLKDPVPYKVRIVPESKNIFLVVPPWRGTEPTLSLLVDTVGDTIHYKPNCYKFEMFRESNTTGLDEMQLYTTKSMVCFKEEFSDTVFCVCAKDSSFKSRMILNSHGTIITPKIRGGSEAPGNVRVSINTIFETSRYVFYCCYIKDNQNRILENRILFDKSTTTKYELDIEKEYINGDYSIGPHFEYRSKLKDDLSGGPDFSMHYQNFYCSGDKLFSFVEAITLGRYVSSEDFMNAEVSDTEKKEKLKKLANFLSNTDNPVLTIVTPKE